MTGGPGPVIGRAAELARLELLVTRRLDGLLHGELLARSPGPGSDPSGARAYGPGDDARRIDWNLSARSLAPQVRTTDADRELSTWVVVDRSASMRFGTGDREKAAVASAVLAAFGFLTARPGNRFGVITAGGPTPERHGPVSGRSARLALLARCWDAPAPDGPARSGLADALGLLERLPTPRGLVVVVSDFLDGAWERPLARIALAHEVVAAQIVDPRELALPDVGTITVRDPETGRLLDVPTGTAAVRERYAAAAADRHARIAAAVHDAGADRVELTTDRDWLVDLARFVGRRRFAGRIPVRRSHPPRHLRSVS